VNSFFLAFEIPSDSNPDYAVIREEHRTLLASHGNQPIASIHAGAEYRADNDVQPSGGLCQPQISGFCGKLSVFLGFVPFLGHFRGEFTPF
jgi:hypothetical protein